MKLLLATGNKHKVAEITAILRENLGQSFSALELLTTADLPPHQPPVEDGRTFAENAQKKGLFYADLSKVLTLADDSGLEVEALGGRPGILSSRYAPTNPERIAKILKEMETIPAGKRQARFVCAAILVAPAGYSRLSLGYCYGEIAFTARGEYGFGFDPVFYLPELGKTLAELPMAEKNKLSHRARAVGQLLPLIKKLIDFDEKLTEDELYKLFVEA